MAARRKRERYSEIIRTEGRQRAGEVQAFPRTKTCEKRPRPCPLLGRTRDRPETLPTSCSICLRSPAEMSMPLPPVIERLKQKAPPSELGDWVRRNVFQWPDAKIKLIPASFHELFARFGVYLRESSVLVAEKPMDDSFWKSAPKSQAFEPVLIHYLEMELRQRPDDERVLWSLAGLAVYHCDNDFGREYLVPLCVKDPSSVQWLVESAMRVLYDSGRETTDDLRRRLERIETQTPDFRVGLGRYADVTYKALARAARIALQVMQGGRLPDWRPEQG